MVLERSNIGVGAVEVIGAGPVFRIEHGCVFAEIEIEGVCVRVIQSTEGQAHNQ
jgi:hypothetical protein